MSYRCFITALSACTLPIAPAALRAQGFEGTVTYATNPASAKPGKLVYRVKGTKARADLTGATGAPPGAYMLLDATSGKMMSVMPAQEMYMTMDMNAMGDKMNEPAAPKKKRVRKITRTGKKETIAGYRCEHYVMGERQDSDVCAAKGLGMFIGGKGLRRGQGMFGGLPAGYEGYEEFARDGFLPLKVSTTRNGKKEVVLQATQIEKKSLDAALFTVPAGYQELDMGKMMPQMPQQKPKQPGN